jgi:HAD superfamily hydrolase (TIGR01509 family)
MIARRMIPLFDLGNVIVKVDFSPFLSWLTAQSASKDRAHAQSVLKSSLFYDFEFGKVKGPEFARILASLYSAEFSAQEAEAAFCSIFPGLVPGMVELLGELARRGPVYCLSNTNEVHLDWLRHNLPECLSSFTRVFASHEMHERKPHPQIYRNVAAALSAAPEEIVFFDDLPENVAGAEKIGMRAHLFTEAGAAREALKGILI